MYVKLDIANICNDESQKEKLELFFATKNVRYKDRYLLNSQQY